MPVFNAARDVEIDAQSCHNFKKITLVFYSLIFIVICDLFSLMFILIIICRC